MRGEDIMGKITGICISEKRGVQKHFIEEANIIADWGIEGDAQMCIRDSLKEVGVFSTEIK